MVRTFQFCPTKPVKSRYEDIIPDVTMAEERDKATGIINRVILEGKGAHHPHILLVDDADNVVAKYPVPEKATLRVSEGDEVGSRCLAGIDAT